MTEKYAQAAHAMQVLADDLKSLQMAVSFRIHTANDNNANQFIISLDEEREKLYFDYFQPDDHVLSTEYGNPPRVELIDFNQKHRQFILQVKESNRKLVRYKDISYANSPGGLKSRNNVFGKDVARQVFGVALPESTTYEIKRETPDDFRQIWHCRITATVPASTSYFLIGFDEKHMFVSMLPRRIVTVKEAHAALFPRYLKGRKYVRQGEFFFSPVNEREERTIRKFFMVLHFDVQRDAAIEKQNGDSDHFASCWMKCHEVQYVHSLIRHDRHAPLFLNGWHRVFVNREQPAQGNSWD